MSYSIRQNNLFAAEDYQKIYRSYKNIDFTAYEYDTIKSTLINYIKSYYPEDFNDYIESSEFIALIEMLAMLTTSISFRVDMNTRENFLDTAQRKDSVIRLAEMLNYQPRRNITTSGLLKIVAVKTTEPLNDSLGRSIQNSKIYWSDDNNADWYEQYILILNAAFQSTNRFGKPTKAGKINDVQTQLYSFNTQTTTAVAYGFNVTTNSKSYPFELVNPDFIDGEYIYEKHIDYSNAFSIMYRNDGNGTTSKDTGFFLYTKQGQINKQDHAFDTPLPNRKVTLSAQNINDSDIYVQQIDELGEVLDQWKKVPALSGNNIVYNSLSINERNIYSVTNGIDDGVVINFSDGNFGNIPVGIFRTWYRTSANEYLVVRPENIQQFNVSIPYISSKNGQKYEITLTYSLEYTIANSAPSETISDIKLRAPSVYYTQDRMVNNEDYNILPLMFGNTILKSKTINRTYSGHSRYIDINDPTGFHQDLIISADDGAIYKEQFTLTTEINIYESNNLVNDFLNVLTNDNLKLFFDDIYVTSYLTAYPNEFNIPVGTLKWKTFPAIGFNDTGAIIDPLTGAIITNQTSNFVYIKSGAKILVSDPVDSTKLSWVGVNSILNHGLMPSDYLINPQSIGPISLSSDVKTQSDIVRVHPAFRIKLTDAELSQLSSMLVYKTSFLAKYDLDIDEWSFVSISGSFNMSDDFTHVTADVNSWLVYAKYTGGETSSDVDTYTFTYRALKYIFESDKKVRFFYDSSEKNYDIYTGKALSDEIVITTQNYSTPESETWQYNESTLAWTNNGIAYQHNSGIVLKERSCNTTNTRVYKNGIEQSSIIIDNGILSTSSIFTIPPSSTDRILIKYSFQTHLDNNLSFSIKDIVLADDGFIEQNKIEIIPSDVDESGTIDDPLSFSKIVDINDVIFFEKYSDAYGYEYSKPMVRYYHNIYEYTDTNNEFNLNINPMQIGDKNITTVEVIVIDAVSPTTALVKQHFKEAILAQSGNSQFNAFLTSLNNKIICIKHALSSGKTQYVFDVLICNPNSSGDERVLYKYEIDATIVPYYVKNGKSFSLNKYELPRTNFYFMWKHYCPANNRIDPSISNIMDIHVLTSSYYNDVISWKNTEEKLINFPLAPTSSELAIQFGELNKYKMLSDHLIFHSAKFKPLFGKNSEPELQANFKIVKAHGINISDNEIKTKVIKTIDLFFSIDNFDFGEGFYFTELSAFIHQQLINYISTIVIVPTYSTSKFGNLFQIKAESNGLFISTATVDNVVIVQGLTEINMRM